MRIVQRLQIICDLANAILTIRQRSLLLEHASDIAEFADVIIQLTSRGDEWVADNLERINEAQIKALDMIPSRIHTRR